MIINGETLIKVEEIHKVFDDSLHALNGVSEEIQKGEVVVIVGPSGSGKSTFLRSLNLLEVPTSGHIYFEGVDITGKQTDIDRHRQKMGMVFQHFNLFPHKTILENITLAPIKLLKKSREEAEKEGMQLLRKVGLEEKAGAYPSQLSGGQKQRIMIARAIAPKPKIIMFDEATSALDNITQKQVSESLSGLRSTRIVIAHRLSTIKQCDRIIYLEDGKIAEDGTFDQLVALNGKFAELVRRQMI